MADDTQLHGDPKRQAVASVRGYAYQFWHTLYAWITLKPDEILYVEAAEDFDRIGPVGAEAVQVKHGGTSITLRSRPVQAAIGNFWDLRSANANRDIRYRYLTNATPTVEVGRPFGVDVPGLVIWQQCVRTGEKLQELRTFLLEELDHAGVQDFLSSACDGDFRNQLLRPMVWDMGQGEISVVESAIADVLVREGSIYGMLPSEAASTIPHLLTHVISVTHTDEGRSLTHRQFLEQFEKAAFVQISRQEYNQLRANIAPPTTLGGSPPTAASSASYDVPPLPPNVVRRSSLVQEIRQRLAEAGTLAITGSSGMGKSTLAKLLAETSEHEPIWVSLRDLSGATVAQTLRAVAQLPHLSRQSILLILDDISLDPADTRIFENELLLVKYRVNQRHGLTVLTSHRGFPGQLNRALDLNASSSYEISSLSANEIRTLATQLGCANFECAGVYAAHCLIQTSGHPQLVQAFLRDAASHQWPRLTLDDLGQPAEPVRLERLEIRNALTRALTQEQLEMVYRLSVVPQKFRRDHAVAIGSYQRFSSGTRIQHPGDAFDRLVGPWVESMGQGYFNLSPVLQGAANQIWSAEIIQEVRRDIGNAILSCGNLTQHEAQNVLILAIFTRNMPLLMSVLSGLSENAEETWSYVAQDFSWVLYVESLPGKAMFPEDARANCLFRRFQYTVAAEVDPESASKILDRWEEELPATDSGEEAVTMRFMFLITMCTHNQVPVAIGRSVKSISELIEISDASPLPYLGNLQDGDGGEFDDTFHGMSRFAVLFGMNLTRCRSVADIRVLLASLDAVDRNVRTRMFEAFEPPVNGAALAINEVWLREAKKDEPEWDECLMVFEEAIECGIRWGSKRFTEVAACAAVIVYEEFLHDLDGAIKLLDRITSCIGESVVLEVQRAMALFHHGRNEEAFDLWNRWLPQWPLVQGDWIPTVRDSWRKAAIAAAKMERWNEAVQCFDNGRDWASAQNQVDFVIGFLADAGFAAYKGDEGDSALKYLEASLVTLPPESQAISELRFIQINKCVGHIVMWCAYESAGYAVDGFIEPPVGFCSSPIRDEEFRNLGYTPHDYLFLHLLTLECRTGHDLHLYSKYLDQLISSDFPYVRSQAWEITLYHKLIGLDLDDFPLVVAAWVNAIEDGKQFAARGKSPDDRDIRIESDERPCSKKQVAAPTTIFGTALLALIGEGSLKLGQLDVWQSLLGKTNLSRGSSDFLREFERSLECDENEVLRTLQDGGRSHDERFAAALAIACREDVHPDDLFYAHFLLFSALISLDQFAWATAGANALGTLLKRQWSKVIGSPGLLRTPRITVPEIRAECANDRRVGFQLVAAILNAAADAVRVTLRSEDREKLRRTAE